MPESDDSPATSRMFLLGIVVWWMVKAQIPSRGPLKNGRKTVEELFQAVKARDENHEALDKAGLIWYGKESPDPNNDKRRVMYGTELPDNGRVYRNTLRPD